MVHLVGILIGLNKRLSVSSIWRLDNAGCELITGHKVSFQILCSSSRDTLWNGEETSPIRLFRCLTAQSF